MTSALQLCLVRHGETAWSLSGQHTGTTDLPLTAHGEAQARALAPRLVQMGFAHVLVHGVSVVKDGRPTGARPGKSIRDR